MQWLWWSPLQVATLKQTMPDGCTFLAQHSVHILPSSDVTKNGDCISFWQQCCVHNLSGRENWWCNTWKVLLSKTCLNYTMKSHTCTFKQVSLKLTWPKTCGVISYLFIGDKNVDFISHDFMFVVMQQMLWNRGFFVHTSSKMFVINKDSFCLQSGNAYVITNFIFRMEIELLSQRVSPFAGWK